MPDSRRDAPPLSPEEPEAEVNSSDLVRAPRFWAHWGTRLFRAMLRAKEEPGG